MGTKNNPGAFDCYANAEPDEPMFVLLGRDPAAWATVLVWATLRQAISHEPDKEAEAVACASALETWARQLGKGEQIDKIMAALAELQVGLRQVGSSSAMRTLASMSEAANDDGGDDGSTAP